MTQTIGQKTALCDRDLNLWLEEAIAKLKAGNFQNLDIENLIEINRQLKLESANKNG